MSQPLPIVFIHYGMSSYLPFTIGQAKLSSRTSPLILIGDAHNRSMPLVKHVDMNSYSAQAGAFQKIYRHLSPNGEPYELFCFIRWFILRDFLKASGLTQVMHLDSDVLLYVDANEEQNRWRDYELTLVRGVCAGNMFVNGLAALEELCQIIWDMYAGPGSVGALEAMYEEKKKQSCGISDMDALLALYNANRGRVAEMTGIQSDNTYWDANIHLDEGFETAGGRKLVRFVNGLPYSRHIASTNDIRFKALHFQGIAKNYIEPAFRQSCASRVVSTAA